ncbi:hypothetical protein ACIRO1_45240 [Streptomyces sp. NPDC102381]|jgi:hypothetical protein|uniref:hypothetical protein n=1 Tax=Streptomyces sp. NPDC102381 TaxID=3366164 RepID=UPI003804D2B6
MATTSPWPDVLQAIYADMVMRAAHLEPLEPYRHHNRPWASRCMRCGRIVRPRYRQIRDGWGGCRHCAAVARNAAARAARTNNSAPPARTAPTEEDTTC